MIRTHQSDPGIVEAVLVCRDDIIYRLYSVFYAF